MEDNQIVDLYWARNELAIAASKEKYDNYCRKIAMNVLNSEEDVSECANDMYLSAWNSMPTSRPEKLGAFLATIIRNLALDVYRKNHSAKRGQGTVEVALDELTEVAGMGTTEDEVAAGLLAHTIDTFLSELKSEQRIIFVKRYFYMESLEEICDELKLGEGKVKTSLFRMRGKLKEYLQKEGYAV